MRHAPQGASQNKPSAVTCTLPKSVSIGSLSKRPSSTVVAAGERDLHLTDPAQAFTKCNIRMAEPAYHEGRAHDVPASA